MPTGIRPELTIHYSILNAEHYFFFYLNFSENIVLLNVGKRKGKYKKGERSTLE